MNVAVLLSIYLMTVVCQVKICKVYPGECSSFVEYLFNDWCAK